MHQGHFRFNFRAITEANLGLRYLRSLPFPCCPADSPIMGSPGFRRGQPVLHRRGARGVGWAEPSETDRATQMKDDLAFTSAVELAALIARRAVSPVEAVDAVLGRIEKAQPALNAFITVCGEEARAAAKTAEAAVMRGDAVGPLHGVPFAVKDLVNTAGVRTTFGSVALAGNVPAADSPAVARLKVAGAGLSRSPAQRDQRKGREPRQTKGRHLSNPFIELLKIPHLTTQAGNLPRIHNRREHIARLTAAVDDKPLASDQRVENFVTRPVPGLTCCIGHRHGSNAGN